MPFLDGIRHGQNKHIYMFQSESNEASTETEMFSRAIMKFALYLIIKIHEEESFREKAFNLIFF